MTNFRNRTTGNVISDREVKALHRNVSFGPTTFDDLGYDPIFQTPRPEPTTLYKVVSRDGVVQDELGNWTEAWVERDMTQGEIDAINLALIPKVPQSVTRLQAIKQLHRVGLTQTIKTFLDQVGNEEYKIDFEEASVFERNSATIAAIAPALSLTSEDIDQLFIDASKI